MSRRWRYFNTFQNTTTENVFFINIYEAGKEEMNFLVWRMKKVNLAETYRYMFSLPESGEIFGGLENSRI